MHICVSKKENNMRIIKVGRARLSKKVLAEIVVVLAGGGVIAYPTETSYGLGADCENKKAVRKIFRIKQRPTQNQLLLVAGSLAQARRHVRLRGKSLQLAKKYWPGPLSLVVKWKHKQSGDVGIRVSGSALVRQIALAFGRPITSTSANIAGASDPYSGTTVAHMFSKQSYKPDILLDAGLCPVRPPSTIVRVSSAGGVEILRQGKIHVS